MELPSVATETSGPTTTGLPLESTTDFPLQTTTESDEEKLRQILESIWPKPQFWVLIACHMIVFIVGLIGNALVCIAVCRNHTMRTVTNLFIVNLAVADFLVLLFCMPLTVPVDITQTWFFGSVCCKVITSLQVGPETRGRRDGEEQAGNMRHRQWRKDITIFNENRTAIPPKF